MLSTANTATFNFSNNAKDVGQFSAWSPERTSLDLQPFDLEVIDMRSLSVAPSLDQQGFCLAKHDIDGAWEDPTWVSDVYVPSCLDLVQKLTGAKATINMYYPIERRTKEVKSIAGPAKFIHFDQPREEYSAQARVKAAEHGYEMGRAAIYNVWKAITPPPQAMPLALCDRRDVPVGDQVRGVTVEAGGIEAPLICLVPPSTPYPAYYVPDMTLDESIVFLAADFDPNNPLGCPHTGIVPPSDPAKLVDRRSIELRVLALFD